MRYIILTLILIFVLPIWVFKYPALGDYPIHLFKVQVMKEYLNPLFGFNKYFDIYPYPCFYSLSYYIILGLSNLFPVHIAGKIFLTLYIISLPISVIYFLKSQGKGLINALFSFLLIYNSFFHKGNIGFVASIPVTLVAISYLTTRAISLKNYIISSVLLLIICLLHPYSLGVVCAFILLRNRKAGLTILPSLLLLAINIFTLPMVPEFSIKWLSPLMKVREFAIYFFSFEYFREGILILPLYGVYLYLFISSSYKSLLRFGLLIIAFFILPDHFMGVDHVAQRILPFTILFGLVEIKETKKITPLLTPLLLLYLLIICSAWMRVNKVYNNYSRILENIRSPSELVVEAEKGDLYLGQINIFGHFQFKRLIEVGGISEPRFFEGPPVFYTGKNQLNKWVIKFDKINTSYNIKAEPTNLNAK